jgi:hypothetical protein
MNAVKHGLRSDAPVIPGVEDFDEWDQFRDGIIASYDPSGELELELARRIALLLWRLRRAARYETEATVRFLDEIPDDIAEAATYGKKFGIPVEDTITMEKIEQLISARLLPTKEVTERVMRSEAHLHRLWVQTHHELEALQARRKGTRPSPLARLDVAASPI